MNLKTMNKKINQLVNFNNNLFQKKRTDGSQMIIKLRRDWSIRESNIPIKKINV